MQKLMIAQIGCACLVLGSCSTIRDWMPEMGSKSSSEASAIEEDAPMADVEDDMSMAEAKDDMSMAEAKDDMSMASDEGDMTVTGDKPEVEEDAVAFTKPEIEQGKFEMGNSNVTIIPEPEGSGAHKYCIRGSDGSLRVTLTNTGNMASASGGSIDVTYSANGGEVTNSAPYPALAIDESTTASVPIAPGCFSPDCLFSIQWTETRNVAGVCIG